MFRGFTFLSVLGVLRFRGSGGFRGLSGFRGLEV